MAQKHTCKPFSLTLLAGVIGQLLIGSQVSAQTSDETEAQKEEKIVVVGRRVSQTDIAIGTDEATNTLAVTRDELLSAPSGISGLKMLENLPGFNVQTDGALGLYEFGNSVQVRAFQLSQMGFVLDGIPMGRSDAFGGSPIFRYVDNENLGAVVASPGAGDVSAPTYASLGPIASYSTVRPSEDMGGMVAVTVGDFDLQRTFVKLETGDIDGFRAYVSRSKTDSDLWRGPGTIDREHIEAKALYEFGDSYIQATYVANDFFDYDSPSAPASTFASNYYYSYADSIPEGCISSAGSVYDYNGDGSIDDDDFTPVFTGSNCTSYYEDRINIRDDKLYSLGFGTYFSEDIKLDVTAYYEDKDGYGVSPDSYSNTLGIYTRQAAAGLGSRDIVIHCLNYQMWMGGLTDHLGLETTGAVVVPFGVGDSERLVQTILDVGINAISCTPSYPARLEQVIQKRFAGLKPRDLGLRKGFMGGEAGLDDLTFRHRLEETWGMKVMNSNYGVSDVLCNFAGQCTEQNDLHYLALDVMFPELVNPDSLERLPWEADREGELVLTNLYKECQPLVRFRTGDLVRLTSTEICLCGRTAPRFRVIGRIDDMVTVRGVNVFPSTLSSAVHSQIELNGQYRVRLRKPPPYDQLPLEVELAKGVSNSNLVSKTLTQAIAKALRITVDLTLLKSGALSRTDGKTQRVIKEYES